MQLGATKLDPIYMYVTFTGSNVECRPTSNSLLVYCIVSAKDEIVVLCVICFLVKFFFRCVKLRLRRFRLSFQSQLHFDIIKMKVFRSDS